MPRDDVSGMQTQLPTLASVPPEPQPSGGRAELSVVSSPPPPLPTAESTFSIAELETAAILRALATTHGNVSSAARLLKIGRATLYRRITELKLDVATLRAEHV